MVTPWIVIRRRSQACGYGPLRTCATLQTSGAARLHQSHLSGIGPDLRRPFQIVMAGVERANEPVELQRGFPNLEQQTAALASVANSAPAIDGWVILLVAAAPAIEFARADLQALSILPRGTIQMNAVRAPGEVGQVSRDQRLHCGARDSSDPHL